MPEQETDEFQFQMYMDIWTRTPSATPHQPKKNEMLIFGLHSTSDDQLGWSMDSNPIGYPSPTKKLKCSFLDYIQILISQAGWWTWTPSATPHQPKKMKCSLLITFNFWWSAGLVDGLEPHPPPLSNQKNEMLIFGLHSTSDDWPRWWMDSNPICHPSPARKMKCLFLFYIHFWWLAGLVNGLEPHPPPLSSQKMKCLFLDYIQLLMISWADQWTRTPSATRLQPKNWNARFWITFKFWSAGLVDGLEPHLPPLSSQKKWNVHFWITFNFWWSAGLVDGLEPHPPPLSNQKNEMLIFGLHSTSDDWPCWWMDSNPICHPSPAKKWNAHFWIMFNFWWLAGLVDGLKPHLPPLSSQKNEMLIFGLLSTSDDQLGWSINSNPICHLSPAKKKQEVSITGIIKKVFRYVVHFECYRKLISIEIFMFHKFRL